MFGSFTDGKLLAAVLLSMMCWAYWPGPAAASSIRGHTTGATSNNRLRAFCQSTQRPVSLRRGLADKLSSLRETVENSMTDIERIRATPVDTTSTFSQNTNMASLITDLAVSMDNLHCMGRALDVLCRHRRNRNCPHGLASLPLYQHHVLTDNAQKLRGRADFQRAYRYVLRNFEQLSASVDESANSAAGQNCILWQGNSAEVLRRSFASVSIAEALLNDINARCQELGN